MIDPVQNPQPDSKELPFLLPGWLQAGVDRLRSVWARFQAWRTPTVDRWLATAIVSASLLFLGMLLFQQWADVAPYLQEMQPGLLLGALGATFAALILGGLLWHFVQKALGIGLGWQASLTIHFSSMITKYMPGYGWQYMAKAYLSKRGTGQAKRVGLALVTELGILIMGGLILAGLVAGRLGKQWVVASYLPSWGWYLLVIGVGAAGIVWAMALNRMGSVDREKISYSALAISVVMSMVGWAFQIMAVWLIARSLYPVTPGASPQMLFALVLSSIVSILVIVVPGGIGVREMTLTLLLADILPLSLGGVVAVLFRLALVVAEVSLFGLILLGQRFGLAGPRVEEQASLPADKHE